MLKTVLLAFLGLSGLSPSAAAADQDVIDSDTYFYGQSPPVYPSPQMSGQGEWKESFEKAKALVSKMTIEEKVNLTSGASIGNGCSGNISPIPRLGFHGMCLTDAGQGVRMTDFVSSFPSGVHVGASWNKDLAGQRGVAMGGEFKKKGVNVLLGPVVGPAWRVATSGRNWEGFAADPYLSGSLAAETVRGVQSENVITSVKHFIANEQESYRMPGIGNATEALSSNVDDKTMHELYLWPFQDAVRAGSGNIMCSYQRINNSYGCANSKTMNGLLKTELGFQGFVVSDWSAQHAGVATSLAGMDMTMPNGGDFWGDALIKSVKNGSVPKDRLDDMATRIIASWYQFKQDEAFPHPGIGMPKDLFKPHDIVDARDPEARPTLMQGAVEGHVLVKNTKDTLPLKKPRLLSLYGYSATTPDLYAPISDSVYAAAWVVGAEPIDAIDVVSGFIQAPNPDFPVIGRNGSMLSGGGSGATAPANFMSPFEALRQRTYAEGTAVFNDFVSEKPSVHPESDACLVFANAWATEGHDRPALQDNYTDTLIKSVADQCSKTVVIFQNAGARLVDGFVDHPNVTAIIFSHLPGQDIGPALVSLLYGDSNFSGKLPYTVAKKESDYGHLLGPDVPEGKYAKYPQSNFTEGVYTDYKHFDQHNITPRYEFGFGLSYTNFSVTNLNLELVHGARVDEYPAGQIIQGGHADLFDNVYLATAQISNTGKVAGAQVVQLYVGIPNGPVRQLRGFAKHHLAPGQNVTVTLPLTRRDLSTWNTEKQAWHLQRGEYSIHVGTSSRDLPLKASITF